MLTVPISQQSYHEPKREGWIAECDPRQTQELYRCPRSLNLLSAVGCLWMWGGRIVMLTTHTLRVQCVELYHHFPIRLHSVIGKQSDNSVLL